MSFLGCVIIEHQPARPAVSILAGDFRVVSVNVFCEVALS